MGSIVSRAGQIIVDLTSLEMTGDHQQELLRVVEAAVVGHLARIFTDTKVVTICMSPNNGQKPKAE